jgi:GT2 family glycosyltransferase
METGLSIIIVNYKSAGLILDCLATVYAQTREIRFEIIVVDNASGDNSRATILSSYPEVNWIEMNYNAGFARANNEGIRNAKAGIVLLLNADTLIIDRAIENSYGLFARSSYIACGVQLLNRDRTAQISGNYFMKGGLNYLLPLPYFGKLVKTCGDIFHIRKPNLPDSDSTIEVDWVNGAFLMVKKSAIEQAGLLDEDFFLYGEEAEWCSRLKNAGRICIFGECKVIHLQGETATSTFESGDKSYKNLFDRKGLQIMLSNLVRIRKQYGVFWYLSILFFYVFEIPVFFIGLVLSNLIYGEKTINTFSEFKGYCKNIVAILKLTRIILKNRPFFYKVL